MNAVVSSRQSLEGLQTTLEAVHAVGGLVIGSIGRAALFTQLMGNPLLEFDARETSLLTTQYGKPRDIDAIGIDKFDPDLQGLPHLVDGTAFGIIGRLISKDAHGAWSYVGHDLVRHDLDPQCFEPLETNILGVPCITVRPAAHMALEYGPRRIGHQLLDQYLPPTERDFLNSGIYGPLWSPKARK